MVDLLVVILNRRERGRLREISPYHILWNHHCLWGINARGFLGFPLTTNLRPHERLTK